MSAAIPAIYGLFSAASLAHLFATKRGSLFLRSQIVLIFALPVFLMWSLGGFVQGSAGRQPCGSSRFWPPSSRRGSWRPVSGQRSHCGRDRPAAVQLRHLGRHREHRQPHGRHGGAGRNPGRPETAALLGQGWRLERQGEVVVKGKGSMTTFRLSDADAA